LGCSTDFWVGVGTGSLPWAIIDLTILSILWPLREFVVIIRSPLARARIKLFVGLPLKPGEEAALEMARKSDG